MASLARINPCITRRLIPVSPAIHKRGAHVGVNGGCFGNVMFSILHVTVCTGRDDIVFGIERLCPIPGLAFSLVNHTVIRLHVHLKLILFRTRMANTATGGFSCLRRRKSVTCMAAITPIFCYGMTRSEEHTSELQSQ